MHVTLHNPPTIFSPRHVPSWLLLSLAAGGVNAGAFLACQRFVTHVTGLASQIGMDVGQWRLLGEYTVVIICFILGAMASVFALQGRYHRGKAPLHALPLVVVSVLLAVVAFMGHANVFGPIGESVEELADFALLSILSFAMGLQNATVATSTGMAVRTTHMTGPATDLGVHLATSFYIRGEERHKALRGAALRGGKLIAFTAGAALMVPLIRASGYLAFLVPALTILIATGLSFVPAWSFAEDSNGTPVRDAAE